VLWQANPYSLPLFLSTAVASVVAIIAWDRRRAPGAAALAVLSLGVGVWCGGYGVYWALSQGDAQLAASNIITLGSALAPAAFLVFILDVTGRRRWLTRRLLLTLGVIYCVTVLVNWTNGWHHLWDANVRLRTSGGLQVVESDQGPLYWLLAIYYGYGLTLLATGLLAQAFWHARGVYRNQYGLLLLAVVVALGPSLLSEAHLTPWPDLDLAPLGLAISGPLLAYALFHYRLLDLVPIARTQLVDIMQDAMIVLDRQNRVIDINPAALALTGWTGRSPVGQPAGVVFANWPDLVARHADIFETDAHIQLDPTHAMQLSITPLHDAAGHTSGRLIMLRDISALKQAERDLQTANTQLRAHLARIENLQTELQEQAIRDALTGLYNRRFLEETFPREIARARRESEPLSVIFVDLDHFKAVNDTYGHAAGDEVLQAICQFLVQSARASDIVCRYGGEEILIICPGMTLASAEDRAEGWRQTIAATPTEVNGTGIRVTISAGMAACPAHGQSMEALILAADSALYAAKAAGRDCVRTAALATAN
jgi:diguanylate cyclase (GGDEF)-like protein/PAS domain S-box-containing protein